jgi:hypothetical protein
LKTQATHYYNCK